MLPRALGTTQVRCNGCPLGASATSPGQSLPPIPSDLRELDQTPVEGCRGVGALGHVWGALTEARVRGGQSGKELLKEMGYRGWCSEHCGWGWELS